jgi:hypothetical protein
MVENNDNLHTVKRRRQQKDVSKPQRKKTGEIVYSSEETSTGE